MLRFEADGGAWFAYSGDYIIAIIVTRPHSEWGEEYRYSFNNINMKHIAKEYGTVKTLKSAKASVRSAWKSWLKLAGLTPCE